MDSQQRMKVRGVYNSKSQEDVLKDRKNTNPRKDDIEMLRSAEEGSSIGGRRLRILRKR